MKTEQLHKAAKIIVDTGYASLSMIQREVQLIHSEACEVMEELERVGIVGPFKGNGPREVLIKDIEKAKILLTEVNDPQIIKAK